MDVTTMENNKAIQGKVTVVSENQSSPHQEVFKSSGDSSGRNSPDLHCTICLSNLENKSFTNSCLHQFCFKCLLQWSKVKAECPLCKQPFTSIIHNVRSVEDYDQYDISDRTIANQTVKGLRWQRTLEQVLEFENFRHAVIPRVYRGLNARHPLWNRPTTSDFRQRLYENGEWVRIHGDGANDMYCQTSPEFYHQNPSNTHRLIPWLNRELIALLRNSDVQVGFLLELILSLILRYAIRSQEFYEHVFPYLHDKTSHFIHEFYNFARSFYDMVMYDEYAQYDRLENLQGNASNTSSPSSIIEVPIVSFEDKTKISNGTRKSPPLSDSLEMPEQTSEHILEDLAVAGPSGTCTTGNVVTTHQDLDEDEDCIILEWEEPKILGIIDLCKSDDDDDDDKINTRFNTQSSKRKWLTFRYDYSSDSCSDDKEETSSFQTKVKMKSVIGAVCNMQLTQKSRHSHKKHKKHRKHKSHKHHYDS